MKGSYEERFKDYEVKGGNWTREWRGDKYPKDSEGKWHHPCFNGGEGCDEKKPEHKATEAHKSGAFVPCAAVALLSLGALAA